ncbi:MAG: formylglycine-generating enzyme family protein, partial [Kiritimatiellae bacterium]|nr:formylglycine-generating enzyme family protein [Kiritimatiellia bacterium]
GSGVWWGMKQTVRPVDSPSQKTVVVEPAGEPPAPQEEAAKEGARLVQEKEGEEEVGGSPAFSKKATPEEESLSESKEMPGIKGELVAFPEETRQDVASPDIMVELTPEEREAAWKAEKGAEEEARTRLDNLQWTARQMASRLDEFEREPTGFASHLEKARKAAESIAGAKALGRVAEATTILGEELGWLNRNQAARDAAMAAEREMAESLDPQLRDYSASEASASAFERGSAVRRAGNEALLAGEFPEASAKLAEAKTLLTKALGDARAFRAELRVKSAKEYQKEERWEKCLEMAKEALVAVPGYEEAEALAKEAEANLVPAVHVEATWEGRQVPATVAYAGESWGTAPLDKTVEEGREYELSLEYEADGKRYAGNITVIGRKGVNRVTIALRERNEPEPGEERDFNLDNETKIRMVWCPAGSFTMGSPEAEERRYDDEMQHHVTLTKGFWLAKYELTQKQWLAVMGNNPSNWKGDDLPVECVSWNDCKEFCDKTGMRFPTEAEWEYACRAGSTGPYAGDGKLENMGWYRENSGQQTHPVGQKLANAWGLCDMHGNVWEWCADWYQKYLGSAAATDPSSPGSGLGRVGRGGGCITYASGCRSAIRFYNSPTYRKDSMGFRPARVGP